eukprot:1056293-Prorocentrum_minimum.AAC.1
MRHTCALRPALRSSTTKGRLCRKHRSTAASSANGSPAGPSSNPRCFVSSTNAGACIRPPGPA